MKPVRMSLLKLTLTLVAVAALSLASTSAALANVRVPGAVPFYTRMGHGEIYHTDAWAVIVFYRNPECVPGDFNLLDRFDIPRAFGCEVAVDGFEIWKDPATIGSPNVAPLMTELRGLGHVPVWFVPWPAIQAAAADEVLTIGDLQDLGPLKGFASAFHETLHPYVDAKQDSLEFDARGTLQDGRPFQVNVTSHWPTATPSTYRFVNTRIAIR